VAEEIPGYVSSWQRYRRWARLRLDGACTAGCRSGQRTIPTVDDAPPPRSLVRPEPWPATAHVGHAWLVLHRRAANNIRPAIVAVEIDQVCVTASERGRGYGRRLLVEAEVWAQTHGASAIELSVWHFNSGAIGVYERYGFRPLWQRMSRPL
jgi:GNAT superfamily N-acetyltransferase